MANRPAAVSYTKQEPWMDRCVDYLNKIVRYYRTNDMSHLTPQMLNLVNTIRNVCIETYPVDVNVTKKFDSDKNLIKYYSRLQTELGNKPISSDIFKASFITNTLPSYAHKFYNKGANQLNNESVEEASKQLSLAVQYQVAQAVATNIPIPLPFDNQLANDYLILLLQKATIPPNIQELLNNQGSNKSFGATRIQMINLLINNVIEDLFSHGSDYYLYVLNENNRSKILSLKENIGYLAPLSTSSDIFEFIASLATTSGKKPSVFQSAAALTMPTQKFTKQPTMSTCQQNLTELAFENEALRRFILQQLSYKNDYTE
jgi:Structural glycoprotein p40/gp41 conserved region